MQIWSGPKWSQVNANARKAWPNLRLLASTFEQCLTLRVSPPPTEVLKEMSGRRNPEEAVAKVFLPQNEADHVYYRWPLSIYRPLYRPPYRPTIARLSADSRPTVDCLSADSRSIVGRQSVDWRPIVPRSVGRLSTRNAAINCRPTIGQVSDKCRSSVGQVSA